MFSHVCCIACDAVGTLIFPDPPVAEVYARTGRKYGATFAADEMRVRFRDAFRDIYQGIVATSEHEEREIWRRIVQKVFLQEYADDLFEELFAHFGRAESWKCFPEVQATLAELSRRGYELLLASNFDRRLNAICDGHEELGGFSRRLISSEAGLFKDNPEFYQTLISTTVFQNHEVLMVGDDWTNDVQSPKSLGMPAVFLDRGQQKAITQRDNVPVISSLLALLDLLP